MIHALSKFRNCKLASRLILVILFFLILPFLTFYCYSYIKIENKTKQQVEQITLESNRQISLSIEHLLDTMVKISTYFLAENMVTSSIRSMQNASVSQYEYLQQYLQLDNTVSSIANSLLPQGAIVALASQDSLYYSTVPSDFLCVSQLLAKVCADFPEVENSIPVFPYYHTNYLSPSPNTSYLSLIRPLPFQNPDAPACFLIVSLPTDAFRDLISPANGSIFLTDSQNHVLYSSSSERQSLSKNEALKEDYIVSDVDISPYGLRLINVILSDDIYADVHLLRNQFILYISIWTSVFLAITFFLIYRQLRPLATLKQHMFQIKDGNLCARIPSITTHDEIGVLTQTFNSMLERLNRLIKEIQEKQTLESELRFEMLLAQINPHFLFNTLNSIRWMSIVAQTENITATISSLGRLLEISMNKMNDIITIKEELENIRSYIQIQQIRYAGQFTVRYQIAPELLAFSTPKLILQPIVENSILHNVSMEHILNILIQGVVENGNVVFHITDNGAGMSPSQITAYLTSSPGGKNYVFRGIGISNVNERIRFLYGKSYGISIDSRMGYYTRVTIILPIQAATGDECLC